MKIVLFSDTFAPEINGVSTSVTTLFYELKKNGHDVFVVTTNPISKKVTFENNILRIPGIRLKWLYNYIFAPIYSRKAMKILKQINPDIIHINTDFSIAQFAYIYAKKTNAALVYTYHTMYEDYTYYITKGKFDRISKWIIREYTCAVANKVSEFIVPSYKSLNYIRNAGINSYINVVPTGIDVKRFSNYQLDLKKKEEYLSSLNIPNDAKIVLSLGRIAKEKNIEELLENFKELSTLEDNVYFLIVGDGPNLPLIKDLAIKLNINDKVKFIGAVPYEEIDFYYSIADVFVAASVSETQGLTYLEAMACDKIVLAKYDSNLTELIKDGVNGYFFTNKEEFLKKIRKILKLNHTIYIEVVKEMRNTVDKLSLNSFYNNIMVVYERAKRNNI